ncbi:hypothetical protein PENVUL_c027G04767 [Penicillium vulpinum]|uniref:Uncharacterized protein n=2 Tax=Penicillium vulpinum TaxID=29845 RepID=A0A1V6RTX9_9EURO|nr:hypothetical protein PENVUL_c027G04767 [Penicillium vulpinum]
MCQKISGIDNFRKIGISRPSCPRIDPSQQRSPLQLYQNPHFVFRSSTIMRFSILTTLAFIGLSVAAIPSGGKCKQDGSLGNCESKLCVQLADEPFGKCK